MCAQHVADAQPSSFPTLLIARDRSDDPSLRRISVAGELNACTATELDRAVTGLLRHPRLRAVEVNLRGVIRLDPVGVDMLARCCTEAIRTGCRLRFTDPHPHAYRALRAAGLTCHVRFAATGSAPRAPR